jgi:hypothetical protein
MVLTGVYKQYFKLFTPSYDKGLSIFFGKLMFATHVEQDLILQSFVRVCVECMLAWCIAPPEECDTDTFVNQALDLMIRN